MSYFADQETAPGGVQSIGEYDAQARQGRRDGLTSHLRKATGASHGVDWSITGTYAGFRVAVDSIPVGTVETWLYAEQLRDEAIQDLIDQGLVGELDGGEDWR